MRASVQLGMEIRHAVRTDRYRLPDPTCRVVTVCELGRISTLAAATLRELGFQRVVALDGGMKSWKEAAFPLVQGKTPLP